MATLAWIEEWAKGAVRREITRRKIEEQLRQRFPEMASHKNAWKTSLFEPLFVEEAEGDSFQAISPQPLIEDREQFMKRAGDAWAAEEARLEQSGYTPTRLITREHVDWFIEYQIKGRSYGDIAKNVGRDRKAVEMAVKDIARKLGCSLREPNSSGRPRKDAAKN